MDDFRKVIRIGTMQAATRHSIFCEIKYQGGNLSITGVEGPMRNGNAYGNAGQIVMSLTTDSVYRYAPDWSAAMLNQFLTYWRRWHLNDMLPGSPAQMDYIRNYEIIHGDYHYRCKSLSDAGLNPDSGYLYNGEPYAYGSAWLREDVPEEVLRWLVNLSDTDRQPAWV